MQSSRIPQLDGLRGLAIAMVLVWHYFVLPLRDQANSTLHFLTALGRLTWSGVDLFFVLSGFLIGGILLDESESANRFRTFYLRRAFRILPIYLVICFTVEFSLLILGLRERSMPWYSYLSFTQNIWMAWHNTFDPLLSYTWSLAVEEQFYLTLPWMIFYLPRKVLTNVLVFVVLTIPALRYLLFVLGCGDVAVHVLSLARADTLALGVLAAIIVRHQPTLDLLARQKNKFRMIPLFPLSILVIATVRDWRLGTTLMGLYGYSALAVFYFSLLLELVVFPNSRLAMWFSNGVLRWLGTISYGAYLLHQVIHTVSNRVILANHAGVLWFLCSGLIALVATLGLAHLSWVHFESKLVSYARRYKYTKASLYVSRLPFATPPKLALKSHSLK